MGVERLDQLGEVGERSGQPIDLIDDEDVDPSGQCNRKDVKLRGFHAISVFELPCRRHSPNPFHF